MTEQTRLFVIGASAGGVKAIRDILKNLSPEFRNPICIVQHTGADHAIPLQQVYASDRTLVQIEDKTSIEEGHVYFCPGGYHVLLEQEGHFSLSQDEPVHFARPSIDVFLESAAASRGDRMVVALLTGSNPDGAEGLRLIQEAGGKVIIQTPSDADFPQMPKAALELVEPDYMVPIHEIPQLFLNLAKGFADEK